MRDERTEAERLAFTLKWVADNEACTGLHPAEVRKASALLVEQERQIAELNAALATKDHLVTVEVTERNYRKEIRGTFVITDPRIYFGEVFVDAMMVEYGPPDWVQFVSRDLVGHATRDWMRDLHEKAYLALIKALAAPSPDGRRMAETGNTGSGSADQQVPGSNPTHPSQRT